MAVYICYAGMMCVGLAINIMPVFLTTLRLELAQDAGLSSEQLGRVGASIFAGIVTAIVVTGPSADRLGAKPFTVLGSLLIAAGLLLAALANSYLTLLLAVFIMGLGAGTLDMLLSPVVCALLPERKAAAMNWLHAFYCIGAVMTVVVASSALQSGASWRAIIGWLAIGPALVCVAFATLRIPSLVGENQRRTPLAILGRDSYFYCAMAVIFLAGSTELGMAQWLPAYAEGALGYSKWTSGMALLAFSVLMGAGRIAAGVVGHRLDPISVMTGCCAGAIVLFLLGCFLGNPALALAACVLMGLAVSPLWPSMLGIASDRFPSGGATMFCCLAAAGNFGGMFMPWVIGAATDRFSIRIGLATAGFCPLVMIALLRWMSSAAAPSANTAPASSLQH